MYYYEDGQGEAAVYLCILLLISPIVDSILIIVPFWGRAQLLKMSGHNPWLAIVPFVGSYYIAKEALPDRESAILAGLPALLFIALLIFGSRPLFALVSVALGIVWIYLRLREAATYKELLQLNDLKAFVFALYRPGYYLWIFAKRFVFPKLPIFLPEQMY